VSSPNPISDIGRDTLVEALTEPTMDFGRFDHLQIIRGCGRQPKMSTGDTGLNTLARRPDSRRRPNDFPLGIGEDI